MIASKPLPGWVVVVVVVLLTIASGLMGWFFGGLPR